MDWPGSRLREASTPRTVIFRVLAGRPLADNPTEHRYRRKVGYDKLLCIWWFLGFDADRRRRLLIGRGSELDEERREQMDEIRARNEIHEAWTSVAVAEGRLARNNCSEALDAIHDAEAHYRMACHFTPLGRTQDKLSELRTRLDQMRSNIRIGASRGLAGSATGLGNGLRKSPRSTGALTRPVVPAPSRQSPVHRSGLIAQ